MKNIVFVFAFFWLAASYAQNRNSIWCFGDSAGIDFSDVQNPVTFKSGIRCKSECASISDANGNLLFYVGSDTAIAGISGYVYNRNHQQMPFGWDLYVGNWNHELIIVPMPGDTNKYYIFHTAITDIMGIFYTIVDMSLDNGNGDLIDFNHRLSFDAVCDGVAAVKHANGRDWWLIYALNHVGGQQPNKFYEYLITPAGISPPVVINLGGNHMTNGSDLSFSNDGEKFLFTTITGLIEVYDFDRCTGEMSNPVIVENEFVSTRAIGSGVLSPDKNLVYVTSNDYFSYVYQYDLRANPVSSSRDTIAVFRDIPFCVGMLRLAPNDKIYLSNLYYNGVNYPFPYADSVYNYYNMNLSFINSPDSIGDLCDFQNYSFPLGGSRTYLGLPNNPNYELGALQGSICDSLISVHELSEGNSFMSIYPNPFQDKILLDPKWNSKEMAMEINIENETGQIIFSGKTSFIRQELDLSSLPGGIYFLHLSTENFSFVKKLIRM